MNYEYTDPDGDMLKVESDELEPGSRPAVSLFHRSQYGVSAPVEDAPAIALAILEAAGLADQDSPKRVPSAIRRLKMHEARRKLDAEREALDDKVRAYLNKVLLNPVSHMYRITDHDRAEYARAAEFFQGEQ